MQWNCGCVWLRSMFTKYPSSYLRLFFQLGWQNTSLCKVKWIELVNGVIIGFWLSAVRISEDLRQILKCNECNWLTLTECDCCLMDIERRKPLPSWLPSSSSSCCKWCSNNSWIRRWRQLLSISSSSRSRVRSTGGWTSSFSALLHLFQ